MFTKLLKKTRFSYSVCGKCWKLFYSLNKLALQCERYHRSFKMCCPIYFFRNLITAVNICLFLFFTVLLSEDMDDSTKSSLKGIPSCRTKAGPRDGDLWIQRLKVIHFFIVFMLELYCQLFEISCFCRALLCLNTWIVLSLIESNAYFGECSIA